MTRLYVELAVFGAIVLGLLSWHHRAYEEGISHVLANDANVLAEVKANHAKDMARIEQLNRDTVNDYASKLENAAQDNARLRHDLAGQRVCIDQPSRRTNPVPVTSEPARSTPATPIRPRLQPTVADDLARFAAECQRNTDQLVALLAWLKDSRP